MLKPLAAALLLAAVASAEPAAAAPPAKLKVCPGLAVAALERRFPERAESYAFAGSMLKPFVELWHASRRARLPVSPKRVTVYALPGKPYLVGYQRHGCVIAFLTVQRQELLRWLHPRLGWPA